MERSEKLDKLYNVKGPELVVLLGGLKKDIEEDPLGSLIYVHPLSIHLRSPDPETRKAAYACVHAFLEGAWSRLESQNERIAVTGTVMHYATTFLPLLADPNLYYDVLHDLLVNYALYDDLMPYMLEEVRLLAKSENPLAKMAGRALLGVFSWANVTLGSEVVAREDVDLVVEILQEDDPVFLNVMVLPVRVIMESLPEVYGRIRERLLEIVETQEPPNNALYAQILIEAVISRRDKDFARRLLKSLLLIEGDIIDVHRGNPIFPEVLRSFSNLLDERGKRKVSSILKRIGGSDEGGSD